MTTARGGGCTSLEMCSSIHCQNMKTQYCYNSGMAFTGAILKMASFSSLKVDRTSGNISLGLYMMPEQWVLFMLTVFPTKIILVANFFCSVWSVFALYFPRNQFLFYLNLCTLEPLNSRFSVGKQYACVHSVNSALI